jgi:anaerobic ribonucleoside-triphosphate reductase activating protein
MTTLRVAHLLHGCTTLGPGRRTVFWVRGCARRCPGCVAGPILEDGPSLLLDVDQAVARIVEQSDEEGVTFSGGEPFEQAEALAAIAKRVQEVGRTVMVYTGFTLEELRASPSPGAHALLAVTDILVDGPFVREKQRDLLWRGSANQHIHLLSARYADLASSLDARGVGVELRLDRESNLFWAGVPGPDFIARLRQAGSDRGILLIGHEGVWA